MNKISLLSPLVFFVLQHHAVWSLDRQSQLVTRAEIQSMVDLAAQQMLVQAMQKGIHFHTHQSMPTHVNITNGAAVASATAVQNQEAKTDASLESNPSAQSDTKVSVAAYDLSKDLKYLRDQSSVFLFEHKLKIAFVATCASYALIMYYLRSAHQLLRAHDSWCNWKAAVPVQHLTLTSYKDLASEFNIDLQKKHYLEHSQEPQKRLYALFWSDLQEEVAILKNYLRIYNTTKTLHCSKLFFFAYDKLIIEEKLTRLQFVFDLFVRVQAEDRCRV